ncbi:PepSY domain-containing protein [Gilvimarinus algae]|uniref:PepSY domain-containing protein n=1 Tax=Gilvimarinus algae TaxID=3058037 RepID=A0ABT8TLM7_9GAMM|nr:PepSY domain-containing protein [Gilvimarinus sp. SDUM040014]MDO3383531.1 PepSY domain-containing protein [Gilvimarinus sp. SDUM040014]
MIRPLLCIFLILLASATQARQPIPPFAAPQAINQCAVSAAQAGKIASKTFGGKVLDVKAMQVNGRSVYRVKLLQPSGRIHSVLIDAASGKPLQ